MYILYRLRLTFHDFKINFAYHRKIIDLFLYTILVASVTFIGTIIITKINLISNS